jgi:hypothetical protein
MTEMVPETGMQVRPLSLFGIALTGIFTSALLGAATNAINGWVSPTYFITILGWQGIGEVWRMSIAQGIFEGLIFGVFFSLVFSTGVGIISRASCRYGFAVWHLFLVLAGAFSCWVIGGLTAMGIASLSPEFYRRAIVGVPDEVGPMLAYAWVGGSIWGVQLGGLISVVLGLVIFRSNWRIFSARFRP